MKPILLLVAAFFLAVAAAAQHQTLGLGRQPQLAMDLRQVVRLAFGRNDSIFCASSVDAGVTFSAPVFVAHVPRLHLGSGRGPQLASSKNYSFITAIDYSGTIHSFQLQHRNGQWQKAGRVNDAGGSAEEGLMSLAADSNDHFYALWLDTRGDGKNKIAFTKTTGRTGTWLPNKITYRSRDSTVCECCRPSLAVAGNTVSLMFRNWLHGSRDLYLQQSFNGGTSFQPPQKLGTGTWLLKGCPMDGGGIAQTNQGTHTVWRRGDRIYYCRPGSPEQALAMGKMCTVAALGSRVAVLYQQQKSVRLKWVGEGGDRLLGAGAAPKALVLPHKKMIAVWECEDQIRWTTL